MEKNEILFSIVSPIYRAEGIVEELVKKIQLALKEVTDDYEIILVEDASPDNSWNIIKELCQGDKRIKGISLSKNFGQHYAISAGIENSIGSYVVVMDCDLQDDPKYIPTLYNEIIKGYDIVLAARENRTDNWLKKKVSILFYWILSFLTGTKFDSRVANFGIYSKKVVKAINSMSDRIRVFPIMTNWVGFKSTTVAVKHGVRKSGDSSYNLKKLANLAIDIILSYSDKPIRLVILLGLIISIFSFLFGFITIIRYYIGDITVSGYTSLIFSIWILSGIIILTLGIIGLYLGKTFEATKGRPYYIIKENINV